MSKVFLCIPPNYSYCYDYPPLGTPLLAGFLKGQGMEVVQRDYNIEYLYFWMKKTSNHNRDSSVSTLEINRIILNLFKKKFRSKKEQGLYYSSFLPEDRDGLMYSDNTNSSFYFVERILNSEYLYRYIDDDEENTFYQFFMEQRTVENMVKENVDILGISIISPAQVIGAFTLGRMVKKFLPNIRIVIGGQWASLYATELEKRNDLSRYYDNVIIYEGETPFYLLVQAIRKNEKMQKIPNLIYREKGKFTRTKQYSREDMNSISCPDFDGLPLNLYTFSQIYNGPVLTYQSARECYWNKCAYCVDLPLPKHGYRERDMDLVIQDIKQLIEKYEMAFLEISNASISPKQVKKLSQKLLDNNITINWWSFARLDRGFSKEIFDLAFKAGCATLDFGMESANQRVLDLVNKGVDMTEGERIIKDCFSAGIDVDLQMIVGLPSETVNDALDSLKFLIENMKYIESVDFNIYYVTPGCSVYAHPELYGLTIHKDPNVPFRFFHDFTDNRGDIDQMKARNLITLFYTLAYGHNKEKWIKA